MPDIQRASSRKTRKQPMTGRAIVTPRLLVVAVTARRALDDVRRPGAMWAALRRTLALWRHRARTRAELRSIPAHQLKDLPFDAQAALSEWTKPFWKP
jgi:uncharacterized protein YjiS (DUF1127 family)